MTSKLLNMLTCRSLNFTYFSILNSKTEISIVMASKTCVCKLQFVIFESVYGHKILNVGMIYTKNRPQDENKPELLHHRTRVKIFN